MTLIIKLKGKDEERIKAYSFGFGWHHLKYKKKDRFCAYWVSPVGDFSTSTKYHIVEAKDIEYWSILDEQK